MFTSATVNNDDGVGTDKPPALRLVPDPDRVSQPLDSELTELITPVLPLVGHIVRETVARIPAHVSRDDLTSAALLALVASARSFRADRGVPFAKFAAIRIRGAVVDELRTMDWAARSVRSRAREADRVEQSLRAALGREPRAAEIAAAMAISVDQLQALRSDVDRAVVLSVQRLTEQGALDELPAAEQAPEAVLLDRERLGYVYDAVAELPERLQTVVVGYYFDQRPMNEIAADLGVTESRVSQLHAEAMRLMRHGLDSVLDDRPAAVTESARAAANRAAYCAAVGRRSTVSGRLSYTTVTGDVRRLAGTA